MVHCCSLVKRVDCRGGGYIVEHLPRKKVTDAALELKEVSRLLDMCCRANADRPPLALAMDCHMSFELVHLLFLGLTPSETYSRLPMLEHLKPSQTRVKAPLFPFKTMVYKTEDHPVFGCCDPKHIMKAVSRGLRSSFRCLQVSFGRLYVWNSLEL